MIPPRKRFKYGQAYGDDRYCGFPTKSGRPCKAHSQMIDRGEIIGCYLHDPRRLTYRQMTAIARHPPESPRPRPHNKETTANG
jgi:hypothetical protein